MTELPMTNIWSRRKTAGGVLSLNSVVATIKANTKRDSVTDINSMKFAYWDGKGRDWTNQSPQRQLVESCSGMIFAWPYSSFNKNTTQDMKTNDHKVRMKLTVWMAIRSQGTALWVKLDSMNMVKTSVVAEITSTTTRPDVYNCSWCITFMTYLKESFEMFENKMSWDGDDQMKEMGKRLMVTAETRLSYWFTGWHLTDSESEIEKKTRNPSWSATFFKRSTSKKRVDHGRWLTILVEFSCGGQIIINHIFLHSYFLPGIESVMTSSAVHCEINQVQRKRNLDDAHLVNFLHPHRPRFDNPCSAVEYRPSSSITRLMIINGKLQTDIRKRYHCIHDGCDKAYSKPSRLAEHERSHTGEVCHHKIQNYLSYSSPLASIQVWNM